MPPPRIDGATRRRQAGTSVGENQAERSAFQTAPVEIFEQPLPVGLAFPLAAQKGQQVPAAIPPDPIGHQHLHLLASRRSPHPQTHPVQKQIDIVVAEPGLMKLAHRFIQIARQLRHRLRTYRLSRDGRHHPSYLPGRDASQKRLPDQQRNLLRPPLKSPQSHRQKALASGARDAQPNRPEAGHRIPLVVAVAVLARLPLPPLIPPPARDPVALPLRLQLEKLLPCLPGLSIQIAPETLFHLRQKMLEMLGDRDYLRHWV